MGEVDGNGLPAGWSIRGNQKPDLQVTYLPALPQCTFHWELRRIVVMASYDGKTTHGPWAYMCVRCFIDHGIGLGLGKGQRLIVADTKGPNGR